MSVCVCAFVCGCVCAACRDSSRYLSTEIVYDGNGETVSVPGARGTEGVLVPGVRRTETVFVPGSRGTEGVFVPGARGTAGVR
eukprot:3841731-Rhodomonas_salina.2